MAQELIQVPCIVQGMSPKADRSWKLVFETRELTGDEVKLLADNFQGEGWLVFSPNRDVAPEDIPTDIADAGVKTMSQRLRGKMYRYWVALGGKGDFESYYRTQIQSLIEFYDSKIPEGE